MSLFQLSRPCLLRKYPSVIYRTFSTTWVLRDASPVLSRLRTDLKTAMRAKDTPRLSVLRAVLAAITNASKTPKPIESDTSLYSLLSKQIAGSEKAIEEFESAKRADLVEKEQSQLSVLKGYQSEIPSLTKADLDTICEEVVEKLRREGGKVNQGSAMKQVLAKVQDQVHDARYISEKLKQLTAST